MHLLYHSSFSHFPSPTVCISLNLSLSPLPTSYFSSNHLSPTTYITSPIIASFYSSLPLPPLSLYFFNLFFFSFSPPTHHFILLPEYHFHSTLPPFHRLFFSTCCLFFSCLLFLLYPVLLITHTFLSPLFFFLLLHLLPTAVIGTFTGWGEGWTSFFQIIHGPNPHPPSKEIEESSSSSSSNRIG